MTSSTPLAVVLPLLAVLAISGALAGAAFFYVRRRRKRSEAKPDAENRSKPAEIVSDTVPVNSAAVVPPVAPVAPVPPAEPITRVGTVRRPDDKLPEVLVASGDEIQLSPKLADKNAPQGDGSPRYTRSPRSPLNQQRVGATTPNSVHKLPWTRMLVTLDVDDEELSGGDSDEDDDINENSINEILAGYHSGDDIDEGEDLDADPVRTSNCGV